MNKILALAGINLAVVLAIMWNANHGFIAFLVLLISGGFLVAAYEIKDDASKKTPAFVFIALSIIIALYAGVKNSEDDKVTAQKAKQAAAVVEQARRDALTPEERAKEDEKKAFESTRSTYGFILTKLIKESAFDPDALKLKSPEYYKDGVCVQANGKNRFGAYVGWQEHCYIYKDGKWSYSGPN